MRAPVSQFMLPAADRLPEEHHPCPNHPSAAASGALDDDEPTFAKRNRHRRALPALDASTPSTACPGRSLDHLGPVGAARAGTRPYPSWLVTDLAAVDTELGS